MIWRPRIRTILLIVNLLVLLLPLWGIAALGLYEDELLHQTEAELIAQGAFVGAAFREALLARLHDRDPGLTAGTASSAPAGGSRPSPDIATASSGASETRSSAGDGLEPDLQLYGIPVAPRWRARMDASQPFSPIFARLKRTSEVIRPRAPVAVQPKQPPDPHALSAGERIQPMLRMARNITLAGIRVVDFQGRVVATTGNELGLSLMVREEVRRALAGEHLSLLRDRQSDEPPPPLASISRQSPYRVFVAMPVVEEGRVLGAVVLSRSPMSVYKALYHIRYPLLAAGAVLLIVVLLISVFTSITIARPIAALIRQTERVSRGEQSAVEVLSTPITQEVGLLSEAFAGMARTLEDRAGYIRAFAANVSHEFKTPLTSIRGTVELLRDHLEAMSAEERERFLDNLEQDALRLDRLVRRLLELARADVHEPSDARASIPEVLERVASRFRSAGLTIELELSPDAATVRLVPETLESILSNLLDNSRQHGGAGVMVRMTARRDQAEDGGWMEIDVSDDGPGISSANAARVFDAFFTTARERGGTGLGLSIVRSLVSAHGGTITLLPVERGTAFRLRLPC